MDEYSKEIQDLEVQLQALVEAEEDPREIAELKGQLEILKALYESSVGLLRRGGEQPSLRRSLALRGYGDWTLDNVYAFVFETSVDLPGDHRSLLAGVKETDFADLLFSPDAADDDPLA